MAEGCRTIAALLRRHHHHVASHTHETDDPCPSCLGRWAEANSVVHLQELTAQFIEGQLHAHPHYAGATVDDETEDLIPALAAINRGGCLTTCSQPGEIGDGWAQRAMASGYCTEATLNALVAGCLATDLMVLGLPLGLNFGARVCVSRQGQTETMWTGYFQDPGEAFAGDSTELRTELGDLWCVDVLDPMWGRNDLLWPTVVAALTDRRARQFAY